MSEWGVKPKELHFEDQDYFIAWMDESGNGYDIKKLRAFCFIQNIDLPEDDDILLRRLIKSTAGYSYLSFSTYKNLSIHEWNAVTSRTAKAVWENFALIDLNKFNLCKPDLRKMLAPSIEKRAEKHEFFLKWGFRKPW